jgi:hypothetical protein
MIVQKRDTAKSEKMLLRLPDDLRAALRAKATEGGKTLTAEIVKRLNESVLLDEISAVEDQIDNIDSAAAKAMLPHAERIKELAEEMKKKVNDDIQKIETAAYFRIRKMIEQVLEEVLARHGVIKK